MTALPARPSSGPPGDAVRPGTLLIRTSTLPNGVVLQVTGEVDMDTAPNLASHLTATISEAVAPHPVVLDLRKVEFFSSNGLSVLLGSHSLCTERNTPLRIVANNRAVVRPIEATNLDEILSLHQTVEEALTSPSHQQ
jgi:anti-sigma B factor antagonist